MLDRVVKSIEEYANGREIVMYGKWDYVKNQLTEAGYPVEKIFTQNTILLQDKSRGYMNFKELKGQSNQYYVILPFFLPDNGIQQRDTMKKFGYAEKEDYVFWPDKEFVIADPNGKYTDDCGNVIDAKCKNVKVRIVGVNNCVTIKDGVQVDVSLSIVVNGRGHKIVIGERCVFKGGASQIMILGDLSAHSTIEIGDSCRFTNDSLIGRDNCEMKIGDKATFASNTKMNLHPNSRLIIGRDCMFSFDIVVQTGDGHSIFDMETGKNIGVIKSDGSFLHEIELEDHIWVGRDAMITSGAQKTVVGEGSVIGAKSFVKGVFPNNCTIAGIPAKVLKRNIAWSRENQSDNIDGCAGYTRLTEEQPDRNIGASERIRQLENEVRRLKGAIKRVHIRANRKQR